jgi:hypothetical protein
METGCIYRGVGTESLQTCYVCDYVSELCRKKMKWFSFITIISTIHMFDKKTHTENGKGIRPFSWLVQIRAGNEAIMWCTSSTDKGFLYSVKLYCTYNVIGCNACVRTCVWTDASTRHKSALKNIPCACMVTQKKRVSQKKKSPLPPLTCHTQNTHECQHMVISPHGGTEAKHNLAGSHISCKPLTVYSCGEIEQVTCRAWTWVALYLHSSIRLLCTLPKVWW